jgi:hypothetical protein
MAVINATQSEQTISRYVGVGELFTYAASQLKGATSDEWQVEGQPPSGLPSFSEMQAQGAGVAYTQDQVVLNLAALQAARNVDDETCYFTATTTTQGDTTRLGPGNATFAYAPDGTLWEIATGSSGWENVSGVPADFPTRTDMDARHAALAWAPPGALPGTPSARDAATAVGDGIVTVTCYVLDVAQFPPASSSGTTYYKVTQQRVDTRTASVTQSGQKVEFCFDGAQVVSAVVGMSYWSMTYNGTTDHQTHDIALHVGPLTIDGDTVSATPTATLEGENHDLGSLTLNLCCIAMLVEDSQIAFDAASAIGSGGHSGYFPTPSPSSISQAFVTGWSAAYPGSQQHHVQTFRTSAGTASDGDACTAITATVVMQDHSNHSAQSPTLDGGLIVAGAPETGLVCTTVEKQTTSSFSITMPKAVSSVAPLIHDLYVTYGKNTDHDIRTIGGGTTGWSIAGDGTTVTFDNAWAFMGDGDSGSKHTQDSSSYVSLVVFGIPR